MAKTIGGLGRVRNEDGSLVYMDTAERARGCGSLSIKEKGEKTENVTGSWRRSREADHTGLRTDRIDGSKR